MDPDHHPGNVNNGVKMRTYMKYGLICISLASAAIPVHAAYKCVDEKGNVTYQTKACQSNELQTKTKVSSKKIPSGSQTEPKQDEFTSDQLMDSTQALLIKQKIATAISALTPIRIMTMDYHSVNGDWPTQLSDIGLDKDNMKSSTVDSVKMGGNGDFAAELNESFGDNKLIVFRPESVMGGTSIEWKCFANFTSEQLSTPGLPLCESSAKPEISAVVSRSVSRKNQNDQEFLRPGEKRMLENYEERGRKLKEAKKKSVEESRKRKEEEEKEKDNDRTPISPRHYPDVK